MRVLDDITEAGGLGQSGWTYFSGSTSNFLTTPKGSVVRRGVTYSGTYVLRSSLSGAVMDLRSPTASQGVKEFYVKCRYRRAETGTVWSFRGYDASGALLFLMHQQGGAVFVQNAAFTTIMADPSGIPPVNTWIVLELHMVIDAVSGTGSLKMDNVEVDTYSGALGVGDGNGVAAWGIGPSNQTAYYDDLGVNAPSLRYDTGTIGVAPVADDVLTGAGGGEITVTAFLSGNATAGTILGHKWNGIAFNDGEVLTSSATLVAKVDAPNADFKNGFELNSGWIGNSVVMRFEPTGNGNSSELTGSDGNKVDNYLLVDGTGGADFVEALVAGERDTYATSVAGSLPAVVDCTIPHISVHTYAQSALTGIDGVSLVTRYGGTDYDGPRLALPSASIGLSDSLDTRPDDDTTAWDSTSAGATEPGQVFVA